ELLSRRTDIYYVGYIEGDAIYRGVVDIVVCDGFVGNVMLKATEGVARMISQHLKSAFEKSIWTKLAGLCILPILKKVKQHMDPARYNGASFLGLQGIVIKSHGSANSVSYANAIEQAILEARRLGKPL
ncbi:MAG: phosphate acyltransferase, partial [Gammaproteobacteria bacterium]